MLLMCSKVLLNFERKKCFAVISCISRQFNCKNTTGFMGATNRGMLSSASFVKLFELFSMNSVSFVDSFCYHTFSAYILCSFLFDYILLCFIKKLYPTLFSLLFECMSLYCGTKPETVEQPITQTLYCNEPKNT